MFLAGTIHLLCDIGVWRATTWSFDVTIFPQRKMKTDLTDNTGLLETENRGNVSKMSSVYVGQRPANYALRRSNNVRRVLPWSNKNDVSRRRPISAARHYLYPVR